MALPVIILASGNPHKLREFQEILGDCVELRPLPEGYSLPPETGTTFHENSALKALAVARRFHQYALADDSGLEVEALAGAPGVYSARYCGVEGDDAGNRRRLLANLNEYQEMAERKAHFSCILTLACPWGEIRQYEGRVDGAIIHHERGEGGFGYDPLFVPDGYSETFAELPAAEKNRISHRYRAIEALLAEGWLKRLPPLRVEHAPDCFGEILCPAEDGGGVQVEDSHTLVIEARPGTLWQKNNNAVNLCATAPLQGPSAVEVRVWSNPCCPGEQAGFYLYYDPDNYVKLVRECLEGKTWYVVAREHDGKAEVISKQEAAQASKCGLLRCEYHNDQVTMLLREDDSAAWQVAGQVDLSQFGGTPRFLLAAHGHHQEGRKQARFDELLFVSPAKKQ